MNSQSQFCICKHRGLNLQIDKNHNFPILNLHFKHIILTFASSNFIVFTNTNTINYGYYQPD